MKMMKTQMDDESVKYIEPEMEVIEFGKVTTIVDASSTDNGGGGSTQPEPDVPITW
jgi:hypothetical protein